MIWFHWETIKKINGSSLRLSESSGSRTILSSFIDQQIWEFFFENFLKIEAKFQSFKSLNNNYKWHPNWPESIEKIWERLSVLLTGRLKVEVRQRKTTRILVWYFMPVPETKQTCFSFGLQKKLYKTSKVYKCSLISKALFILLPSSKPISEWKNPLNRMLWFIWTWEFFSSLITNPFLMFDKMQKYFWL